MWTLQRSRQAHELADGFVALRIEVRGLRVGHSGVNIHEGRGNAIKLLVRVLCRLCRLERQWGLRLSTLQGGSARDALTREAFATDHVQTRYQNKGSS